MIEEYLEAVAALVKVRAGADEELGAAQRAVAAKAEIRRAEHRAVEQRLKQSKQQLAGLLDEARSNQIQVAAGSVEDYGGSDPLALLEQTNARLREALEAAIHTRQAALAERERARREQEEQEAREKKRREAAAARAAAASRRDRTLWVAMAAALTATILGGLLMTSLAGIAAPMIAVAFVCYLAGDQPSTLPARAIAVAQPTGTPTPSGTTVWPWFAAAVGGALFGAYGLAALAGGAPPAAYGAALALAAVCLTAIMVGRNRSSTPPDPRRT